MGENFRRVSLSPEAGSTSEFSPQTRDVKLIADRSRCSLIPAPVNCRCNLSLPRPADAAPVIRGRDRNNRDRLQGPRQIAGPEAVDSEQRQARRRRHSGAGAGSLPVGPRGSRFGLVFDDPLVICDRNAHPKTVSRKKRKGRRHSRRNRREYLPTDFTDFFKTGSGQAVGPAASQPLSSEGPASETKLSSGRTPETTAHPLREGLRAEMPRNTGIHFLCVCSLFFNP